MLLSWIFIIGHVSECCCVVISYDCKTRVCVYSHLGHLLILFYHAVGENDDFVILYLNFTCSRLKTTNVISDVSSVWSVIVMSDVDSRNVCEILK